VVIAVLRAGRALTETSSCPARDARKAHSLKKEKVNTANTSHFQRLSTMGRQLMLARIGRSTHGDVRTARRGKWVGAKC
jgi:hypothetical protein